MVVELACLRTGPAAFEIDTRSSDHTETDVCRLDVFGPRYASPFKGLRSVVRKRPTRLAKCTIMRTGLQMAVAILTRVGKFMNLDWQVCSRARLSRDAR